MSPIGRVVTGGFCVEDMTIPTKIIRFFAIICQKVLAKCAKGMYNDKAILWNAYLCIILRRTFPCPIVFFKA
jgi:hypothetical protein